jgi:hypothetical protein
MMRTSQPISRFAGVILSAVLSTLTFGCASGGSETYSSAPAERPAATAPSTEAVSGADAESGFAGVWQGTTLASCAAFAHLPSRCDAEQVVTITLLQGKNGKLTGGYKCAYGNMDCYHANYTGKVIDVTTAGKRMNVRVMMPDATSCIYTGMNVNQTINGGYTCYQGGGLIEQGSWRARRSY